MTPEAAVQNQEPLSQVSRVTNVFTAPGKTFQDINRSASWWLPFLIIAVMSLAFAFVVDKKIGFDKVTENQMRLNPKQMERMEQAPPEQRARGMAIAEKVTKSIAWASPVIVIVFYIVMAAILMGSFNFGAGAKVRFGQSMAIVTYANLVGVVKPLLAIIAIFAGVSSDGFTFQNPVATNPGYFIDPVQNHMLFVIASALDIVTIWTLVLVALGFVYVGKVKRNVAFCIVFGWWALLVLIQLGGAALS